MKALYDVLTGHTGVEGHTEVGTITGLDYWTMEYLDSPKLQNTTRSVQNRSYTFLFPQLLR